MCLVIDNEEHRRRTLTFVDKKLKRFPVARITRQDMIVYKKLDVGENFIKTPYMHTDIVFKDGKCIMNAKFGKKINLTPDNTYVIYEGIHATIDCQHSYASNRLTFKAIIPKGTKYYIGDWRDIVAEKLIILNEIV